MKHDGLIQCRCKEWRKPEEMCMDSTCIYCEDVNTQDEEPAINELEPNDFELAFDVNDLADGYEVEDDDDGENEWWGAF